jgi:Ferritin-like domain
MRAPETEQPIPSDTDLSWSPDSEAAREISGTLNASLADLFTLLLKTKNFHWHLCGPQFRDYHLMFDERAAEISNAVNLLACASPQARGSTIRSLEHVLRLARLRGNVKQEGARRLSLPRCPASAAPAALLAAPNVAASLSNPNSHLQSLWARRSPQRVAAVDHEGSARDVA